MSKRQLFRAASLFVFLYIIYILVIVAMPYGVRSAEVQAKESVQITDAVLTYNGESMPVTLPYSLKGLEIGTEVIVRMTVPDADFGYICVKSVYSPLNAKIEGVFDESYGQRGTYPDCMSDPPTFFKIIPVKEKISGKTLELRYEYPSAIQELYIYAPIYGSYMAIARKLGERTGIASIAGIFMMVLVNILYHYGIMQRVVAILGKAMNKSQTAQDQLEAKIQDYLFSFCYLANSGD